MHLVGWLITVIIIIIITRPGDSAPNTINTCNGQDCTSFISEHGQNGRILIDQPALWTENEGVLLWVYPPHQVQLLT